MVMSWIVSICLIIGMVFFSGGCIGILRLPDCYTRLHAAGKLDTLGGLMMVSGLALYSILPLTLEAVLMGIKIMLIVVFIFLSSPTATHAMVDAAIRAGLEPWFKENQGEAS
jgi:multicomponent Na+:H+ antiporter subunit G